eukprot:Gb_35000 [translate_table: standard]
MGNCKSTMKCMKNTCGGKSDGDACEDVIGMSTLDSPSCSRSTTNLYADLKEFSRVVDINQLNCFMDFIDDRLSEIKARLAADNTTLDYGKDYIKPESVKSGILFASHIIQKISTEVERLEKTRIPQEIGKMAIEAMNVVGQSHWILLGFSIVASVLDKIEKVSSNVSECIDLLDTMIELAKTLERINNEILNDADILNKAVQVIVEGATVCCEYISKGKSFRFGYSSYITLSLFFVHSHR